MEEFYKKVLAALQAEDKECAVTLCMDTLK